MAGVRWTDRSSGARASSWRRATTGRSGSASSRTGRARRAGSRPAISRGRRRCLCCLPSARRHSCCAAFRERTDRVLQRRRWRRAEMPAQLMAGEPETTEQARAHIEASRARISEKLDEIEERLVEKRVALREKLDVKKRLLNHVDEKPLRSVAIAAGVGFLLGTIGRRRSRGHVDAHEREELRELLREARESGEDLPSVSIGRAHPTFWQEARAQLVGALTAALVAAVTERLRPREVREA